MLNRLPSNELEAPDAERGLDLREAINFVWREWKFIAAIVGVAMLVGAVHLMRETSLYTASAQVLLDTRKERAAGQEAILTDEILSLSVMESHISLIRSTALLRRVVDKERLAGPEEASPSTTVEPSLGRETPAADQSIIGRVRSYIPGQSSREPSPDSSIIPSRVLVAVEGLRGMTSVSRVGQSYILSISVTSPDPARSARLSNAIADAFIVDKLEARFEAAKRASGWLSDRIVELRAQVRDSEEAVRKFRAAHNLLQGTANATLNQQQISELNGRLVTARTELGEKKSRLDLLVSMEKNNKIGDVQSLLPDVVTSPIITGLRQQAAAIAQREADLLARYGDRHPLVVNVRAERRDSERNMVMEIQRFVKNEYDLAKAKADSLERALRELTGDADNDALMALRELERTAAVNKSLFEDFLQRARVTQEQSTFEARDARLITPALPPRASSHPRKGQVMMISIVLGLLIGIGAAVCKEMLNAGFTTSRQIEDMLDLPVLASFSQIEPRDRTVNGKVLSLPLYTVLKPLSRYAEALRALRSGVQMTDVDNPPKVVQVTSTVPSEGKTTLALSLAASAATSGLNVLYIDADMRHPSGSKFLGPEQERGLVDLLAGSVIAKDVIRFREDLKYWTLSAGSKTQNPPDLLGSDRMKSLIASFKKSFDFVVIDTPPAGPVIDPVVVSHLADKVVFVLRWASTARELVQSTIQQLAGHKKVAGVVLNFVKDKEARKYGKYAYSYYYSGRYYKNYYSE